MERFGETNTGDIKQSRRCSSEVVGFLREKLGENREFRFEDFQGENNERQLNQLMIQNQQM